MREQVIHITLWAAIKWKFLLGHCEIEAGNNLTSSEPFVHFLWSELEKGKLETQDNCHLESVFG